jgi:hypothetical protein
VLGRAGGGWVVCVRKSVIRVSDWDSRFGEALVGRFTLGRSREGWVGRRIRTLNALAGLERCDA